MTTLSQQTHLLQILGILCGSFLVTLVLGRMERGGGRGFARFVLWVMLLGYLAGFAWLTVLCRAPQGTWRAQLMPLWSYREAFSFDGGIGIQRLGIAREILLNVCLCVPLGYLIPALLDEMRGPWLPTLGGTFALSAFTEAVQYFTRRGLCETDDVIHNLLGGLIGLLAWIIANALIDAATRRR